MKTIILAGGSGTRLFPLSREHFPKQFIRLFDDVSLFQKTVTRALLFSTEAEITIVTNADHAFLVRDQLAEIDCHASILVEPEGKNTLPAIYYGVKTIAEEHGPSRIAVLSSDQLIDSDSDYLFAFQRAEHLSKDHLVVFGVLPTSPHTGYGYIRPGREIGGGGDEANNAEGHTVDAFFEKPDQTTAEVYLNEGYLWNSGMFVFNSSIFLDECRQHAPAVVEAFELPVDEAYRTTPRISIDYGIMEKTDRAAVVPFASGWNDLGTFDALYSVLPKNGDNNTVRGEYIGIDSHDNLIIGDRLIATIGISNLAIVETKDAILVAAREQAQHVGEVAKLLKERGDDRASFHTQVHRPWGSYTTLEEGGGTGGKEGGKEGGTYKIKRVSVPPGRRLSLQMHHHRSEHWVVVNGCAEVTIGEKTFFLKNGESTYVPAGTVHRLANPGMLQLELIEVQIGEYTGEDDIVRIEDDYERV